MEEMDGIDIDLQTFDGELEDATTGDLFIGYRPMERLSSVKLMDDEFIAVAKPEIAEEVRTFRPSELRAVRWLQETPAGSRTGQADPLVDWLGRVGLGLDDIGPRLAFHHPLLLVDAAFHGLGVSLVRHSLVVDHLARHQLVQLFHHAVPGAGPIYLSFAASQRRDPVIGKVHDWLQQQAATHRQMMTVKETEARILRSVANAQMNARGEQPQGPPYQLAWPSQWPVSTATKKVAGQIS
jgi:DNA-binding transcriptional LysR family regulator